MMAGRTYSSHNFECPHCGTEYGDSWELKREEDIDIECPGCEKSYTGCAEISVSYTAWPTEPNAGALHNQK